MLGEFLGIYLLGMDLVEGGKGANSLRPGIQWQIGSLRNCECHDRGEANIGSYSLQRLTDDTGYFRAKLSNLLLNYASEINGSLETSIFKQLVSGEPVEARLPYGEPFILKQYAKLMFNCNELPRDVEHTHAYFRRFIIIPFDVTIPEERQDKNLHTRIRE